MIRRSILDIHYSKIDLAIFSSTMKCSPQEKIWHGQHPNYLESKLERDRYFFSEAFPF